MKSMRQGWHHHDCMGTPQAWDHRCVRVHTAPHMRLLQAT